MDLLMSVGLGFVLGVAATFLALMIGNFLEESEKKRKAEKEALLSRVRHLEEEFFKSKNPKDNEGPKQCAS